MSRFDDLLRQRWYAHIDDTIGGWCVANVDKPPSGHDHRRGEFAVANFLSEDTARHIAGLHNDWLAEEQSAE